MDILEKWKSKCLIAVLIILMMIELFAFMKVNKYQNDITIAFVNNSHQEVVIKPTTTVIDYKQIIDDLRTHYQNDDVVGKLTIAGTDIDEVIMQANDNNYYLNHNEFGEYQAEGSIYEDYRTNLDSKKVLIFGHSSPGWNVPFNELEKYYDKDFYNNHKYITITTENGANEYIIFSVFVETSDFSYMNLKITNDTYNQYLKKYKDNSLYNTGVEVLDNDEILILQTCSNNSKYSNYNKKYLLVISKKINNKEEKK